jgi:hypothetical protein
VQNVKCKFNEKELLYFEFCSLNFSFGIEVQLVPKAELLRKFELLRLSPSPSLLRGRVRATEG